MSAVTPNTMSLWKGLVGAVQRPGVTFLGGAQGGYVNVVTLAQNLEEFTKKVQSALDELGLELIDLDEAEILPMDLSKARVSDEIRTTARTAREENSVAFGTFYVFNEGLDQKRQN